MLKKEDHACVRLHKASKATTSRAVVARKNPTKGYQLQLGGVGVCDSGCKKRVHIAVYGHKKNLSAASTVKRKAGALVAKEEK